jgi:hypothetical protein
MSLMTLAAAAPVAAYGPIDQQQTDHPFEAGGLTCTEGHTGGVMQGVTPGATQWGVVSLFLFTTPWATGPANVTLEIRDASADGPALASATAVVPDSSGNWIDFAFAPPVSLTPGAIVYLYAETNDQAAWAMTNYDAYPGGEQYAQCSPFTEPFALGSEFGDFTFITYQPESAEPPDDPTEPVATAVADLPLSAFAARGHSSAMQSRLDVVAERIAAGDTAGAIRDLQNLRRHVDGCADAAGSPDRNDWITDCAAQLEIRALIDGLIADLGG